MRCWIVILLLIPMFTLRAEAAETRTAAVSVEGANDDYTPTELTVKKGELIVISAQGNVVTGAWMGATKDAFGHRGRCGSGSDTDGALVMKIGTGGAVRVGALYVAEADRDGPVKLKVRDTKYTDNTGAYAVSVTIFPAETLSAAKMLTVEAANDEWTPTELTLGASDYFIVLADGKATVLGDQRTPDGTPCNGETPVDLDGDGALMAKIGTATFVRTGRAFAAVAPAPGPLKLRIRSKNKYEGNSGSYAVRVLVPPGISSGVTAAAAPAAVGPSEDPRPPILAPTPR